MATSPLPPLEPRQISLLDEINKGVGIYHIMGEILIKNLAGDILIAFAVLHVFSFAVFWGPTP